jgi:hypothetical protein
VCERWVRARHAYVSTCHRRVASDAFRSVALSSSNLRMLRSLRFREYFERVVVPHKSLLLWGTDDDLHAPFPNSDGRMMRDLPMGVGYWVVRGSHTVVLGGLLAVARLSDSFLCGDLDDECGSHAGNAVPPPSRRRRPDVEAERPPRSSRRQLFCDFVSMVAASTNKPVRRMVPSPQLQSRL